MRDSGGDDQDLSTDQQLDYLTRWCKENELIMSRAFVDVATPGSSTVGRDQFLEMISHFHDPACSDAGVIVWKMSRFSRDMDDSMYYRADLRRRGYVLYSIHDNIPDSSDGRIFEALIDWRNKKYLEDLSLDVKRGLHHIVNQYKAIPGTPPKGFKREVIDIGKRRNGLPHTVSRWVPDPETWEVCRQAWVMRSRGVPIRQIHDQLRLFSALGSYTTFFTNRIYIGEMVYGKSVIHDYCEPLISREVWDLVQSMARKNSKDYNPMKGMLNAKHPRRANSRFILSGLVYCARCGSLMNGDSVNFRSGKRLDYYHCGKSHRNMECKALRIPKEALETIVIDQLAQYIMDPSILQMTEEEMDNNHREKTDKQRISLAALKAETEENQRKIRNLAIKISEDYSKSTALVELLHELEHKESALQIQLEALRAQADKNLTFTPSPQYREDLAKALDLLKTEDDRSLKKRIIQQFVKQIMAEREGDKIRGVVYFRYPEIDDTTTKSHRRESNP